jgi:hypothetical protein
MEADALRLPARYRRSIGEEITMLKNRVHAIPAGYGINIDATDIFGRRGIAQIHGAISVLNDSDSFILSGLLASGRN